MTQLIKQVHVVFLNDAPLCASDDIERANDELKTAARKEAKRQGLSHAGLLPSRYYYHIHTIPFYSEEG